MLNYVFFAFLLIIPSMALADLDPAVQGKQAENFISTLGAQAIEALEKTKGDDVVRKTALKDILNNNFDIDAIARFSLGRYWAVADEQQKAEYTDLFRQMVVDVYTQRFSEYTNQDFKVVGSRTLGKDLIVQSQVSSDKGAPVHVDWRVRDGKVLDVIVEGVSMSVTQRSEFASIIQRNGGQVASLINHLRK